MFISVMFFSSLLSILFVNSLNTCIFSFILWVFPLHLPSTQRKDLIRGMQIYRIAVSTTLRTCNHCPWTLGRVRTPRWPKYPEAKRGKKDVFLGVGGSGRGRGGGGGTWRCGKEGGEGEEGTWEGIYADGKGCYVPLRRTLETKRHLFSGITMLLSCSFTGKFRVKTHKF